MRGPAALLQAATAALAQLLQVANPRQLKPGELVRSLNSTPLGEVLSDHRLRQHRARAGLRICDEDGKRLDLLRYAAWLAFERHHPPAVPQGAPPNSAAGSHAVGPERDRNALRMQAQRKRIRTLQIPPCADRERRAQMEKDIFAWLRYYFHKIFTHEFTDQQKTIITVLEEALIKLGDQAIAATRGEGKSTTAECVLIFMALTGKIRFAMLFSANSEEAERNLAAIKDRLCTNDRLAEDYPEVCWPIRDLEHIAQKARTQLVSGMRHDDGEPFDAVPSHFCWSGKEITLPNVPGSPAAGAIIATRGLDSPVRGVKRGGESLRPDLVILDDPDDSSSVDNPEQGMKLEKKIELDIGGLAGQSKGMARVILTTIRRRNTVSYRFTDPKLKPWNGKRMRFLVNPPDRPELSEEYVQLRLQDLENKSLGTETKLADNYYAKNQRAIEAGVIVGNPYRRPGGERSAYQFYLDELARKGPDYVATELNNDPPEETAPIESGITPHRVQRQVNGLPRKRVPPATVVVVQGIDCRKVALHYSVLAFEQNASAAVIDYGVHETRGTVYGSEDGLDVAILQAIKERMEHVKQNPYRNESGQVVPVMLTLVDAGWRTDAVYQACREIGLGIMPSKGWGRSNGCVGANFSETQRQSKNRTPGDGWFLTRVGPPGAELVLVNMDADRWKGYVHDRFMTDPARAGTMTLYGEAGEPGGRLSVDEKSHHSFSRHITSEVEVEEVIKGVLKRYWKSKSDNNHWLDSTYGACVAASVCGITALPGAGAAAAPPNSASAAAPSEKSIRRWKASARPSGGSARSRGW